MDRKRSVTPINIILIVIALLMALITLILFLIARPMMGPVNDDPALIATDPPEPPPTRLPPEPEPTLPPPEPNPYGRLDFQYDENNYLKLIDGGSVTGIDISSWQGEVDFEAVKSSGVEFVMVRLCYRGYESGKIVFDNYGQQNVENALAAGLQVGVYFFSQAISPEEAEEEAYFILNAVKDYDITMPIVYDWEPVSDPEARTADMDRDTLTRCCKAFLETVKAAGYRPMLYFNRRQAQYHMDISFLKEYDFWLAAYTDRMEFPYQISMWQYTNTGSVPGIEGDVDINVYFPITPDT